MGEFQVIAQGRPETIEMDSMVIELFLSCLVMLVFVGIVLATWVYRSVIKPLGQLQEAARKIKDGDFEFSLEVLEDDDEIGQLCRDFEEMRIKLKESAQEKILYDKENKELISNISHDLKTPLTAIKGYVEGILDGIVSSPEKIEKYVKTIYNKVNDMDNLIDELMFYSKIDTNRIPYVFTKINVLDYFNDCVDDVSLDLDSHNIQINLDAKIDSSTSIVADTEQLKRVMNNIISNAVKYMDKEEGYICICIHDLGDFVKIEVRDNGKGIAPKDIPYIFDRFYRADVSRNSSLGIGIGIGLSIVKKIIEDHGGRIWASGQLGIGTEIHFILKKFQEVKYDE